MHACVVWADGVALLGCVGGVLGTASASARQQAPLTPLLSWCMQFPVLLSCRIAVERALRLLTLLAAVQCELVLNQVE